LFLALNGGIRFRHLADQAMGEIADDHEGGILLVYQVAVGGANLYRMDGDVRRRKRLCGNGVAG
jgi:hypothetical protein